MSVPKDARKEGKLEVCIMARDLAVYTIQICKNEKVFLPQYRSVTNEIIQLAMSINNCIWSANNVIANDTESYRERRNLQSKACIDCNTMLADIEIAAKLYHLSSKRMKYWGQMIVDVRNKCRAWKDSDAKRYSMYR